MEFAAGSFAGWAGPGAAAAVAAGRADVAAAQATAALQQAAAARPAAAAAHHAGASCDSPSTRGVKRLTRESSHEPELGMRELNRLEANALRLRGLLRNAEATPDKRRFSVDLQSQIATLEQTVATGKKEADVQHSDVRARLSGLAL